MKKLPFERSDLVVLLAIVATVVGVLVWGRSNPIDYASLDTSGITYPSGTVLEVISEDLEPTPYDESRYWGSQELRVRVNGGELAGQELQVHNEVSDTHNIICEAGTGVIIRLEMQEGLEPYYSIYNYDRSTGLLGLLAVFALLMIGVGRMKGLRSLIGLAFAIFLIACFLLPAFYHGYPVIPVTVGVVLAITVSSMTLLNGWSAKTRVSILSSMCGVVVAAVFYAIFSTVLHAGGYNMDAAEELIFLRQRAGFEVSDVLFTCVLIASLGAVLDMTMGITSALFEMRQVHPTITQRELFHAGMEMGQDMTGTMCTTLILAFAGGAITTLLSLLTYGTAPFQLLNSDYLTLEVFQSLVGSLAVILSVPLASGFSAWALGRR